MGQIDIKIAKQLWQDAEDSKRNAYYTTGFVIAVLFIYSSIMFYKWKSSIPLTASDFLSGMYAVLAIIFMIFVSIQNNKKAEKIHQLYMESVSNE